MKAAKHEEHFFPYNRFWLFQTTNSLIALGMLMELLMSGGPQVATAKDIHLQGLLVVDFTQNVNIGTFILTQSIQIPYQRRFAQLSPPR